MRKKDFPECENPLNGHRKASTLYSEKSGSAKNKDIFNLTFCKRTAFYSFFLSTT